MFKTFLRKNKTKQTKTNISSLVTLTMFQVPIDPMWSHYLQQGICSITSLESEWTNCTERPCPFRQTKIKECVFIAALQKLSPGELTSSLLVWSWAWKQARDILEPFILVSLSSTCNLSWLQRNLLSCLPTYFPSSYFVFCEPAASSLCKSKLLDPPVWCCHSWQ